MTRIHDQSNTSFSDSMTPRDIVDYLNRYIVGQDKAKRAVAVSLRTRWRRQQLPPEIGDDIIPKNILIIGPTGVGKTEIARRIAKLTRSPFVKVEASKFTEVGYVGRDVESMIRDLTELAVSMVRSEARRSVRKKAEYMAEERILDQLLPQLPEPATGEAVETDHESYQRTREKLKEKFKAGKLDDKTVEIDAQEQFGGMIEVFSSSGIEEIGMQMKDMMPGLFKQKKKRRKMAVRDAFEYYVDEEANKLVDMDQAIREAIRRVENSGIVFIDEIDKVAGRESGSGPDVSREGVQRDLLPIIEGSTVTTKYGLVHTNHILFIGSGAFSVTEPSQLIPEIQGRFPVKVDVHSLTREHLRRILVEPENALTKQYEALLSTEGVHLDFQTEALDVIAELAERINDDSEDIGARRLHTIMELLLEDVSFHASDMDGQTVKITPDYVRANVTVDQVIRSEKIRKKRKPGFK